MVSQIPKITELSKEDVLEFLRESNAIEREYSDEALQDALQAWMYLLTECCTPVDKMILEAHRLLMQRLNSDIAGKWRKCAVYIGGREASDWKDIDPLIRLWVHRWTETPATTEADIRQAHIDFEYIHPFEDGNGRTGRLLMNFQRLKAGLPLLIIHEGTEQHNYYKWFEEKQSLWR